MELETEVAEAEAALVQASENIVPPPDAIGFGNGLNDAPQTNSDAEGSEARYPEYLEDMEVLIEAEEAAAAPP